MYFFKEYNYYYRFERLFDEIVKNNILLKDKKILDIGCSRGFLEKNLIERGCNNIEAWDYEDLRSNDDIYRSEWKYKIVNAENEWPEKDKKFDIIFALEIIEHMIDTDKFIEQCKNKLNPNGFLIISTPNIASLKSRLKLAFGKYPCAMEYRNNDHHVRMYTVPTLKSHLSEYGFEIISCIGLNFLPINWHKNKPLEIFSKLLADNFAELCGNFMLIATLDDNSII